MLEPLKEPLGKGILVHRLNEAVNKLLEDFKPDEGVLKKYGLRIKKLRSTYDSVARKIAQEEHDRIWREEKQNKE